MVPEDNEQTEIISDVTPLLAMAYELNELFGVLREAGFSERVAALITSAYMAELMGEKMPESEDDEDAWEEDPEAGSAD